MKRSSSILLLLAFGLPYAAFGAAITLQAGQRSIKLTLQELRKKLPTVELQVDDPVYTDASNSRANSQANSHGQPAPRFDAFPLDQLIALLGAPSRSYDEIVFQAADGYAPSVSRELIEGTSSAAAHEAFLAYREHGRPLSNPFPEIRQGKAMISPAPFYLIWKKGKKLGDAYPWPYQLVKIELVNFHEKYGKIYPDTPPGSAEMRGFMVFKTECIRCHSIDLIGGDIGPELNVPKNVLEYWNHKTLRTLIKKASDFRARSKMPDFPQLTDANVDDLFAYFRYEMKRR